GFRKHKRNDRHRFENGKEVVVRGIWDKINAVVAPNADDVSIPVAVQGTELEMRKWLGHVSKERAWAIVSGVHLKRLSGLTLEAKPCR
ncbi:unnamed protein product, partial [marine sediment metagenome]